jgi:hypothetical protein
MSAVSVVFDKPRSLKFDLAAIKDLESAMNGQPLGAIVQQLGQFSVTALTLALWAGLKAEDRTLSPNLVTKMLQAYLDQGGELRVLMDAVSEGIQQSGLFSEGQVGNGPTTAAES